MRSEQAIGRIALRLRSGGLQRLFHARQNCGKRTQSFPSAIFIQSHWHGALVFLRKLYSRDTDPGLTHKDSSPQYRPDIDGLRTIAVGLVIAYHYFPNFLPGGFTGVDVFFVISGYLISTIILNQMASGSWRYAGFYTRRINRIFPALTLLLAGNLMLGWYALVPNEFHTLGKHVAASGGFLANAALWGESGYFDNAADTKPLLHMWSLAIEEQFYIVWPVILAATLAFSRLRFTLILGALACGSLIYSSHAAVTAPDAAYYSPLSRFFELAVGGLVAHVLRDGFRVSATARHLIAIAGLAAILIGAALITDSHPFPGYWALLPALGTAALILAGPANLVSRFGLSLRPLVWIGLISYPLYLWHWPLLVWTKLLTLSDTVPALHRLALIGLSVLLAAATWLLLERPLRRRNQTATAVTLTCVMGLVIGIGISFWAGLVTNRLSSPDLEKVVSAANDWNYPSREMELHSRFIDYSFYRRVGSGSTRVLFIGDSNMEQYAPRIEWLIDQQPGSPDAVFATKGGCRFAVPALADQQRDCRGKLASIDTLIKDPQTEAVVIAQQWLNLTAIADDPAIAAGFEQWLATIPSRIRKYIVLNIPTGDGFGPADQLSGSRLGQLTYQPATFRDGKAAQQQLERLNAVITDIASRHGAIVIDPFASLCDTRGCRITDSLGQPAYKDRAHLTASFAREAASFLDEVMLSGKAASK